MAPALRSRFLVYRKNQGILEDFVVLVDPFGEALGSKGVLRSGDDVQDVGLLVPPHPPRAENVPLLRRVPELKSLGRPASAGSFAGAGRQAGKVATVRSPAILRRAPP